MGGQTSPRQKALGFHRLSVRSTVGTGKGVIQAVENVRGVIGPQIIGIDALDQEVSSGALTITGDPARLRSLCQVPLQDVDAACVEVRRAMASGHVGVHLGNHCTGRNLDDPELVRFLCCCADEGVPVM